MTWLCCRHACVPVDFEEVHVSSNTDEEDVHNAIMAIRRNRVALKGGCLKQWTWRGVGVALGMSRLDSCSCVVSITCCAHGLLGAGSMWAR